MKKLLGILMLMIFAFGGVSFAHSSDCDYDECSEAGYGFDECQTVDEKVIYCYSCVATGAIAHSMFSSFGLASVEPSILYSGDILLLTVIVPCNKGSPFVANS